MCDDCKNNAELVMVYGNTKTYRCTKCGCEWEGFLTKEVDVYENNNRQDR